MTKAREERCTRKIGLGFGKKILWIPALLVAVCTIVVGIVGLASPDLLTAVRRQYFASPLAFYSAGILRAAMGGIVILAAPTSRAPKTLRVLGAVMCIQAVIAILARPEHARAILEWEVMRGNAALRVGAMGALAAGSFLAFAIMGRQPASRSES